MKSGTVIILGSWLLLAVAMECAGQQAGHGTTYHPARHGIDGGLAEMVDLVNVEGFEHVLKVEELASFARSVRGSVGFTVHPDFESGTRHAHAVLWYTHLSPTNASWPLYLFDEAEARKGPGQAPKASARAAAEARISDQLKKAKELIDTSGMEGVKVPDDLDYNGGKALAYAVLRLGGSFAHTHRFGDVCMACRNVVPGGNPRHCGLGVQKQKHWTCCGAVERSAPYCRYWKLMQAEDEKEPAADASEPVPPDRVRKAGP